MEENNRMGKTKGLFKKIENIKRTFLPKMGTIKDRNSRPYRSRRDQEMEKIHRRTIQKRL